MGLSGAITNLGSLVAKLLPAVAASAQAPSSSSSPPPETHQIEADLKRLMEVLERIKATLYDAEQREIRDRSVKLWLRELKGVAYDAEDVLGEYHYEVLRAQVEARDASPPNSRKRKQVQMPEWMLDQIKQIMSRFDEICKDRIALRLFEEDGPRRCNSELQIAPTSHFVVESDIIGREREKQELIDLLSSECHDGEVVSVVTIVGTGGLGKTTLAQLAYNDQRICQKFMKGWVCVSEDFNVQRLTRESIESFTRGRKCNLTNLSALQEELSMVIRGKRVLLVLDDVWNEKRSLWESFQGPFKSATLVKILVTTRNEPVARIMQTVPTFILGYLSEEQCWGLFQHYAFGEVNQNEGSKLVEIGKQIMKKCGRLPLAIKSIASLLRHEDEEESWREILESELWECDASNDIFPPLQISYARLPTYLKPCFLYCSMFPKDYQYTVKELVQLWIYQGYIEPNGLKNTEKIGREYAKQLRQRSFFQGRGRDEETWFRLHDIVHDLARFNSENEFYSIEEGKVPDFPRELYHLYVDDGVKLVEPLPSGKFTTLRTLVMGHGIEIFFSFFDFSDAQKLRALKLEYPICELEALSSIVHLKHLRFLSLGRMRFEMLPECICSLYSLQNLTLKWGDHLKELPKSIGNLVSLEELVIEGCHNLRVLPVSLCQLKALTKLLLLWCHKLEELPNDMGNLTNLQALKIVCSNLKVLLVSFCQLKALTKLTLASCNKLKELPNDVGSLTNLRTLKISGSKLKVLPSSFCQLKALTELRLLECIYLEELPNDMGSLTNLQTLKITSSKLKMLPVSLCQLKALTELLLFRCSKLEELPNEMGNLTNLQTLIISGFNLRVLPVSLCQLKSLTKVKLVGCIELEEVPNDIRSLTSLLALVINGIPNSEPNSEFSRKLMGGQTLYVILKCETMGWLRECVDLEGTLCLWRLNHITSLTDVQYANLVSMHKLDYLKLFWGLNNPRLSERSKNEVSLEIKSHQSTFPDEQNDFSLMNRLQPHPNLRKLLIADYGGITFPNWIGNPTSCASLERIVMHSCENLTFVPFGSLCKLKYLVINQCGSFPFLRAESLPLELEELEIVKCRGLISVPGIQKLKSLVELRIADCENLHLLVTNAETSAELTMRTTESLYQNTLWGLRNLTSLRRLQIIGCPKLQLLEDELLTVESCKVEISQCPGLKDWCLEHSITYKDDVKSVSTDHS